MLMIDAAFEPAFAHLGLRSFAAISKFFLGNEHPGKAKVIVRPATLPQPEGEPLAVYYKHYQPLQAEVEFVGRRSKARCEFENYAVFKQLGLPAPERVAVGEERDALGRLLRTFIITRAIPDALTLVEFVRKHCPNRHTAEERSLRDRLCQQVAELTQRMHRDGFFHRDLVWRNILVTWQPPVAPQVWWIDCPRGALCSMGISPRRAANADLASPKVGLTLVFGSRARSLREALSRQQRLDAKPNGSSALNCAIEEIAGRKTGMKIELSIRAPPSGERFYARCCGRMGWTPLPA
jgi:hypothetical protein